MFYATTANVGKQARINYFCGNTLPQLTRHIYNLSLAAAILLSFGALVAQSQPITLKLTGSIIIKGGKSIPYRLELTDSAGYVKGYSITYSEPDEAKAVVEGRMDRDKKKLIFREQSLIYSKGFHPEALCMIKATLEYNSSNKVLKGAITSTDIDNTKCAGGTVLFNNETEIRQFFSPPRPEVPPGAAKEDRPEPVKETPPPVADKYDMVITMKKKVRKDTVVTTAPREAAKQETLVTDKITAGTDKAYIWYSDTVVVDIWDGGNIDGDRVSIQFNGRTVLGNHYLSRERRQLRLRLSDGENTLAIIADNEGSDPPNTATLLLTDRSKQYSIVAYNPKGGISVIKIRKAK
jgi:hypothetical protein